MSLESQHHEFLYGEEFPPGTVRLENSAGTHIVLSPQPTADPNDPLNWSAGRKGLQMTLLCLYTVMAFACLVVGTPLWTAMIQDIDYSYNDLNNSYAADTAALAVGCVLFIPFALRYGRRPVYILTALIITGSAVWSACLHNLGDLYGSNIVMGLAGAVNETLFLVTVADLFFVHQRGTINALYMVMVTIGNYLAPVASGYIASSMGWRWAFWLIAIFMGTISFLMVFFLEETKYIPLHTEGVPVVEIVISDGDTTPKNPKESAHGFSVTSLPQSMPSESEDPNKSEPKRMVQIDHSIPMKSYWQRHGLFTIPGDATVGHSIWRHFWQPFVLLGTIAAVAFCALQYGFALSCVSILAVTQAEFYAAPPYNFGPVGIGNVNLAPAIGSILGSLFGGAAVDWFIVKLAKRNKGIYEPEMRLHLFLLPGIAMPIGIWMYGLTIAHGMPWIINCVGAAFIGFALGGCGDISLTYLLDSYREIAGDALIGVAFVRNALGTILVFAVPPWVNNMGVYSMFVLLGCLGLVVSSTYIPMLIWGKKWRIRCAKRYEYYALRQFGIRSI